MIRANKPYRSVIELKCATMRWVSWHNSKRPHASFDYRAPEQVENGYYDSRRHKSSHNRVGTKIRPLHGV
ncbi:integrase core domain-containing protein [Bifidobacterium avesanii]|uniref:integrase core domain-containing protein n=1 Tax=Bifidobacterium avesanii TaxID=1798157 RepID=UPI003B84692E